MPFLPNSNIKIYKTSDTVNPVWEGTTDSNGRATNIEGIPSLRYGDYVAVSKHCDYDDETTTPFTIPGTNVITMSVGCTSSISTHESIYDHSLITRPIYTAGTKKVFETFEKATASATYIIVQGDYRCEWEGTLRIHYAAHGNNNAPFYTNIFRNGVAVGIERSLQTDIYQQYEEDISGWMVGDRIAIYGHTSGLTPAPVYVNNFWIGVAE